MVLSNIAKDNTCRIMYINGKCQSRKRLYELGLNSGAYVRVIKNDRGPIILGLGGNKIAIGRGIADKIIVE